MSRDLALSVMSTQPHKTRFPWTEADHQAAVGFVRKTLKVLLAARDARDRDAIVAALLTLHALFTVGSNAAEYEAARFVNESLLGVTTH